MNGDDLNNVLSAILKLVAVIGCLVAMIYGARGVFLHLKEKSQGFAPNSLQALAIVFLLPIVVIVALVASIESQALAALLGTVAGYVLSSPKRDGDA
jgi:heme/copper-type cytochrome/quinol oxidase subunit 4